MKTDDIKALAELARINLTDVEADNLKKDFEEILAFVGKVNEVDADLSAEGRLGAVYNVMRDDERPHESGIYTEALLEEAPDREDNFVKVKKIL